MTTYGFGIHFNKNNSKSLILFADSDSDKTYDEGELFQEFKIDTGDYVSGIAGMRFWRIVRRYWKRRFGHCLSKGLFNSDNKQRRHLVLCDNNHKVAKRGCGQKIKNL